MNNELFDLKSTLAQEIDLTSRVRLHEPVVKFLYEDFVTSGVLDTEALILSRFPLSLHRPIIHTLSTHVTKEKSQFVYHLGESMPRPQKESISLAATTDLLWIFALIYDDLQDRDEQRAGSLTAWKKFGEQETMRSIETGYSTVLEYLQQIFGYQSSLLCKYYVEEGVSSIQEHRRISIESPIDELQKNYIKRAQFHTDFPAEVLVKDQSVKDTVIKAFQGINLAGQVLNDIKDMMPSEVSGRNNYSDLRGRLVTIPMKYLWEFCNDLERQHILSLVEKNVVFGNSQIDLINNLIKKYSLFSFLTSYLKNSYTSNLAVLQEIIKNPTSFKIFQEWISYKLSQIDRLLNR